MLVGFVDTSGRAGVGPRKRRKTKVGNRVAYMRTFQYALLIGLAALLVASLAFAISGTAYSMTWTLAPAGWYLVDGLIFVLAFATAIMLRRRPIPVLGHVAPVAMCVTAVLLIVQPAYAVAWLTPTICAAGAALILISWALNTRASSGRRAVVIVGAVLGVGGFLLAAAVSTASWSAHETRASGSGWVAVVSVRDLGVVDTFHSTVWVYRDDGAVRRRRILYRVDGVVPDTLWKDASTVVVDSRILDIMRDTTVDARATPRP